MPFSIFKRYANKVRPLKYKLSTKNLDQFCEDTATSGRVLVVHSEDVDHTPYFPNTFTVTKRVTVPADLHVDLYYNGLSEISGESYDTILCTGLLEHVPDPERLIAEFQRILRPGGVLNISASAVFSIHEGPNDFYHFTQFGFQHLFRNWSSIELLRGSSKPFETIGILIQRVSMQSHIFLPVRLFLDLLAMSIGLLDYFVKDQFSSRTRNDQTRIDSMLPSNIQAVVRK